jgi:CRISPR/Cas system type I-B associated protein Csh2 (Cas7 group RAMP superfamily)
MNMRLMTKKIKEKLKQVMEEGKKFEQAMFLSGDINQDIISQAILSDEKAKSLKEVIVMKRKSKSTQKKLSKKPSKSNINIKRIHF